MITENEKAPQMRIQLLPSPCHVSFINQEHGKTSLKIVTMKLLLSMRMIIRNTPHSDHSYSSPAPLVLSACVTRPTSNQSGSQWLCIMVSWPNCQTQLQQARDTTQGILQICVSVDSTGVSCVNNLGQRQTFES